MDRKYAPDCANCPSAACSPPLGSLDSPEPQKAPASCPMRTSPDLMREALLEYEKPAIKEFARQASIQEFECYEKTDGGMRTKNPRILELVQFSQKMGYKKLGLAFCTGLAAEAKMVTDILQSQGFQVVSSRCKVGAVPKEKIGIKPEQKIGGPASCEAMCNPIAQARILNAEKVDLAIILGLCLGHDTLFMQYCRRPMTTLAVKDRVTGHNPLAAVYLVSSYYARLKSRKQEK